MLSRMVSNAERSSDGAMNYVYRVALDGDIPAKGGPAYEVRLLGLDYHPNGKNVTATVQLDRVIPDDLGREQRVRMFDLRQHTIDTATADFGQFVDDLAARLREEGNPLNRDIIRTVFNRAYLHCWIDAQLVLRAA